MLTALNICYDYKVKPPASKPLNQEGYPGHQLSPPISYSDLRAALLSPMRRNGHSGSRHTSSRQHIRQTPFARQ